MKTYHIQQKITVFANQYNIYEDNNGQPGTMVAYAHQKRLAIKEKFTFYADDSKQQIAFEVQAQKVLELAGTYDVCDENGRVIGVLQKQFKSSLLRSTWQIQHADTKEPVAVIQERSMATAILRRIWGFIPYIGDLPFFMLYHFDFLKPGTEEVTARYNKVTLLRDHYQLQVEDQLLEQTDWRVLVAQGVALDALQSR